MAGMRPVLLMIMILLFYNVWLKAVANNNHAGTIRTELLLVSMPDSTPHATLHFYRAYFPKFVSNVKRASIYINDSLVHELKQNTVASFNVNREGKIRVAVDKKQQTEIEFKVKFGKEYFFRVEVSGGVFNTKATIESVPEAEGREETGILKKEGKL